MAGEHDFHIPDPRDLLKPAVNFVEDNAPQWGVDIYEGIKDVPQIAAAAAMAGAAAPILHEIPGFDELEHSVERFFGVGARKDLCDVIGGLLPALCPGGDRPPHPPDKPEGDGTPEPPKPETHFDQSNFDKLGPDVAAFLKSADAQSLDIDGDTVRIKLSKGYEQSGEGGKIKLGEDISFKVTRGDNGELLMTDINGIKAEIGGPFGTTIDVGIKQIKMHEQDGKAIAEVKADTPIGEQTQTSEVPHDIYALAQNLVEQQDG
jgi:hypothetical protein